MLNRRETSSRPALQHDMLTYSSYYTAMSSILLSGSRLEDKFIGSIRHHLHAHRLSLTQQKILFQRQFYLALLSLSFLSRCHPQAKKRWDSPLSLEKRFKW